MVLILLIYILTVIFHIILMNYFRAISNKDLSSGLVDSAGVLVILCAFLPGELIGVGLAQSASGAKQDTRNSRQYVTGKGCTRAIFSSYSSSNTSCSSSSCEAAHSNVHVVPPPWLVFNFFYFFFLVVV